MDRVAMQTKEFINETVWCDWCWEKLAILFYSHGLLAIIKQNVSVKQSTEKGIFFPCNEFWLLKAAYAIIYFKYHLYLRWATNLLLILYYYTIKNLLDFAFFGSNIFN